MDNKTLLLSVVWLGACGASNGIGDPYEDRIDGPDAPAAPSGTHILPLGDSITEGVPYSYRHPLSELLSHKEIPFNFVGSHTQAGAEKMASVWLDCISQW